MYSIEKLKELIVSIKLNDKKEFEVIQYLNDLEEELEELRFLSKRLTEDQQINENFINKTVELLEESNLELLNSNKKLKKINRDLKISNEELERFAYIASHDLKTPLHTIVQFAGLLKSQLKSNENELVQQAIEFIITGGKRMNNLIIDVLEYSKLSNQNENEERQVINLNELIVGIINSISEYLKESNGKVIIIPPLPNLAANHSKTFLLLKNLIENGIKYNKSESPCVKIFSKVNENYNSIFIKDNGIGINKAYYSKVFQMFERLHSNSEYEGTGLGLSTCKKIVEEMGGHISLESEINVGTVFRVDLPNMDNST